MTVKLVVSSIVASIKFWAMFTMNAAVHLHNTLRSNKLHCEYRRLCVLSSNTVRHYGVLLWNSLTDDVCTTNSFLLFKIISDPTCLSNAKKSFFLDLFML